MKILDVVRDIMSQTKDMTNATFMDRVAFVANPKYNNIFSKLHIDESDDKRFITLKYLSYTVIYSGPTDDEETFTKAYDDFWNEYDGLFRQIRGLTIDLKEICLALYPYDKFFNVNQCAESSEAEVKRRIEIATSIGCSDKLDGSLVSARFYGYGYDDFLVASSGSINPKSSMHCRLAMNHVRRSEDIQRMLRDNPDKTFIFEMIDWADPHIVSYTEGMLGLHLTGVRDMNTEKLWSYNKVIGIAKRYNVLTTELYDLAFDDIMSSLDDKKSSEKEGFVLNIDGFLVKIKYNDFCLAHRVFSDMRSVNGIIKAYVDDQLDDMMSRCPDGQVGRIELVVGMIKEYEIRKRKEVEGWYNANKHLSIAEFCKKAADEAKDIRGLVINLYKGRENNYLKTRSGGYLKLKDMGYSHQEYMERLSSTLQ